MILAAICMEGVINISLRKPVVLASKKRKTLEATIL
jgi:hypothetical protein